MQQEFMDTQAKATKQEREISSLKMRLEETKLKRKDEAAKLKAKIAVLEEGMFFVLLSELNRILKLWHPLADFAFLLIRITAATKYTITTR